MSGILVEPEGGVPRVAGHDDGLLGLRRYGVDAVESVALYGELVADGGEPQRRRRVGVVGVVADAGVVVERREHLASGGIEDFESGHA